MKKLSEAFVNLWENLAGIQIDEKSKIYRIAFFLVLLIGSVWAVMNYISSGQLSDLESDFQDFPARSRRDPSIEALIEQVNKVNKMRSEGSILAGSMTAMNRRLFNDDLAYNLTGTGAGLNNELNLASNSDFDGGTIIIPEVEMPQHIQPPKLQVKAIMQSGKNRLAIINLENAQGLIVRKGFKLPDDYGQIIAINKDSITLRFAYHNFIYSISNTEPVDTTEKKDTRKSLRENMKSRRDIADLYNTR